MKFLRTAGLALLGVGIEGTMAAALDFAAQTTNVPQNAQPTRPRTALGVQETGRIAPATEPARQEGKEAGLFLEQWQRQQQQEARGKDLRWLLGYHQEVRRQQEEDSASMSSSASTTSATGDVASVLSQSGAVYETSTTTAPSGPVTTELGYFTAGGGVYSVSSLSDGVNAVAGKTLSPGGADAIVGGAQVTAASDGILVDGVEVETSTVTISASASASMSSAGVSSSGVAEEGTASAVASGGSAPSPSASVSEDGAGARATSGVGALAALGVVVGALVM